MARPYIRRPPTDAPRTRRAVQVAFLLLNVAIGVLFYRWVADVERGLEPLVSRPPGVEGWLPIAGLMNLKLLLFTGRVPEVHPAGMFLLLAFLLISLLFRRAFCSWLCPIGTLSEWLWHGGQEMFGRTFRVHRYADIPLRSLKYLLLGAFAWVVASMSADDIAGFLASPYGLVADVKMLDFFRHAGEATIGAVSLLVVLSVLSRNVWCRYLCPYGALVGLVSMASPVRIVRSADACIDCGKCARACPSFIPVDTLRSVRTPECTACFSCVAACPVNEALELRPLWSIRRLSAMWVAAGVAAVFLAVVGYAKLTDGWTGHVPEPLLRELVQRASSIQH
ncbi:MAG: 4Fe-4S binding protein [Vicinamibacterales bacterium]